jgi:oligosaccharide repeat unit polymerase
MRPGAERERAIGAGRETRRTGPLRAEFWWLDPAVALLCVAGLTSVAAWWTSPRTFMSEWGTAKLFDDQHLLLIWFWIGCFALGTAIHKLLRAHVERAATDRPDPIWSRPEHFPLQLLSELFWLTVVLTLFGYFAWIAVAVSRGLSISMLSDVLTGEAGAVYAVRREQFETVKGVTTATQFGMASVILGTILYRRTGSGRILFAMLPLGALSLLRALFLSERLAFLELVVPAFLLWVRLWVLDPSSHAAKLRRVVGLAPIIAPVLVVVVFGATEYFRSWSSHYESSGIPLHEFMLTRFAGYYTTAFNNGVLTLDQANWGPTVPRYVLDFLWNFPGMTGSYADIVGFEPTENYGRALQQVLNPEFNNPGGMFLPAYDFGVLLVPVFWFLAGVAARAVFSWFCRERAVGLFLYPMVMLAIVESPRVFYMTSTRAFPTMAVLVAAAVIGPRVSGIIGARRAPAA